MGNNRLCLGTVQFGLNYGINNRTGKPSKEKVFEMLDLAVDKGIECLDTAAAYGDAEELLGEYLASRKPGQKLKVISKLKPNMIEDNCPNAEEIVENEIKASLRRLGLEILDGYLLHTPSNFYNKSIMSGLEKCKKEGLIKNLGVSVYETQHALDAVSSGVVDYIQVPYSVFDQRLNKTDFFEAAGKNNVTVFARAVFLQGLILMKEEDIPENLEIAKKYLREFDAILGRHKMSRLEAAFIYAYRNTNIDYVVFGVDNLAQLKEDIGLAEKNRTVDACIKELYNRFASIEKSIIFPSLWAKKQ